MVPFYTQWKRSKTLGLQLFSGGFKMEPLAINGLKTSQYLQVLRKVKITYFHSFNTMWTETRKTNSVLKQC